MFALANGHPTTLLVICTEAQKRGQLKLARAALHRLEATESTERKSSACGINSLTAAVVLRPSRRD